MIRKVTQKRNPRAVLPADLELGQLIRARRNEAKMSQQTLAAKLGVSFQQIQKYEKGVNRVNASRLNVIANALDMEVAEFFDKDRKPDFSSLLDITDTDTLEMLRAYSRIKDQLTQRQMVMLIEALAEANDIAPTN